MTNAKPTSGLPLPEAMAGNFQDAVRWFTQMWSGVAPAGGTGGMGGVGGNFGAASAMPSMMMPTLDVREVEKRIADLRSVEQWLQLNLGMLHTTIQALEMQRNGLMAWQSLGTSAPLAPAPGSAASSDGAAANAAASHARAHAPAQTATQNATPGAMPGAMPGAIPDAPNAAAFQPGLWWAALQQQFAQMAAGVQGAEPPPTHGERSAEASRNEQAQEHGPAEHRSGNEEGSETG